MLEDQIPLEYFFPQILWIHSNPKLKIPNFLLEGKMQFFFCCPIFESEVFEGSKAVGLLLGEDKDTHDALESL